MRNYSYVVLILVVVEDGLGEINYYDFDYDCYGLNPCCSGRWSRSV